MFITENWRITEEYEAENGHHSSQKLITISISILVFIDSLLCIKVY